MVTYKDIVIGAMKDRTQVDSIYTNFAKAFNTVPTSLAPYRKIKVTWNSRTIFRSVIRSNSGNPAKSGNFGHFLPRIFGGIWFTTGFTSVAVALVSLTT